jgi:hypothetical protein
VNNRFARTHSRTHVRRAGPGSNKWYNLFIGILWGITGKEDKDFATIVKCLPAEWQAADPKPVPEENAPAEPKSVLTEILDGVENVIDFVCNWKDKIKDLFSRRIRRQQRRNKYRMLVQTASSRMARYRRTLGWWADIKNKVKAALGKAISWAKARWEDIKSFAGDFITNIKSLWNQAKAKAKAFLNSTFVQTVQKIYTCVMAAKDIVKALIDIVKGAIEKVGLIATIVGGNVVGLAKLFIDLICNFGDFRAAISNLIDGINEPDTLKKYGLFGRFIGRFTKALTTKKMRRYRLNH